MTKRSTQGRDVSRLDGRLAAMAGLWLLAACAHAGGQVLEAPQGTLIEPGKSYRGSSVEVDPLRHRCASLRFRGELGQRVTFRMHSPPKVFQRFNVSVESADGEQSVNVVTIEDATFTTASTVLPSSGEFTLTCEISNQSSDNFEFTLEFLPTAPPMLVELEEGVPSEGAIQADDPKDALGRRSDLYRFRVGEEVKLVRFAVKSLTEGFVPELTVHRDGPDAFPENADGAASEELPVRDVVYVLVRAAGETELGRYSLEARSADEDR